MVRRTKGKNLLPLSEGQEKLPTPGSVNNTIRGLLALEERQEAVSLTTPSTDAKAKSAKGTRE